MTTNAGEHHRQPAIQEMAQRFTGDNITFAGEWMKSRISHRCDQQDEPVSAHYVSEEAGGIGLGRLEAARSCSRLRAVP